MYRTKTPCLVVCHTQNKTPHLANVMPCYNIRVIMLCVVHAPPFVLPSNSKNRPKLMRCSIFSMFDANSFAVSSVI